MDKLGNLEYASPYSFSFNKVGDEWLCQYYFREKAFIGESPLVSLKKALLAVIELHNEK